MSSFNFDVITLFPKAFELINNLGVITRALNKNLIDYKLLYSKLLILYRRKDLQENMRLKEKLCY